MQSLRRCAKSPFSKLLNLTENSVCNSLNKQCGTSEDSTEVSEKKMTFMNMSLSKIKSKYFLNKKENGHNIIDDKIEEETYTSYKE